MAKKKNKKHAGLPKRIAGVKVPKQLRKSSGSLLHMAQTPIIRDVIASGLVAAAAAMAGTEADRDKKGRRGKAKRKLGHWADAREHDMNKTAQAVGAAVTAAMDKWLGGSLHWRPAAGEEAQQGAEHPADRSADVPGKAVPTAH